MTSFLLGFAVLSLFGAIPVVLVAASRGRRHASLAAAAAMMIGLASLLPLTLDILGGNTFVAKGNWLPEWGFNLSLRLDGLGFLFSVLILGIGQLIVLYASYYLPKSDRLGRFLALLLAFAGGMLGLVLSENILLMFVFWEITSLTSFLLIAYKWEAHDARIAARMALAVTGAGGLALFAGLLLLGHIAESFEFSDILARGPQIHAHPLYAPALLLILTGAFTKSAQFPFHFWLPNAMAAPTPVSAYLHSATMVKAGVFLLARFYPAMGGTDLWFWLVSAVGAVTFVYGAYVALLKHDFKGLLAYSTISHLGLITLLFGLDTPFSAVAGVFHIVNHAIFKASLFMAAGIIDHECGTRDMRRINGLFKYMPHTATLGIVGAASMAGVPLLNGFLSKEMFFAEAVGHPGFETYAWVLPVFATAAGMLSVAYSTRFIHDVFFNGEPVNLPRSPREPARWMLFPIEILVLLCVAVGIMPQFSVGLLLNAAAGSVLPGRLPDYTLAIWHGFNLPLVMSFVAMTGGVLYYLNRKTLFDLHGRYLPHLHTRVIFERLYLWMVRVLGRALVTVDNTSLQRYVVLLVGFSILLGGWAYLSGPGADLQGPLLGTPADAAAIAALAALVIGSLGVAYCHRQKLLAVIFISVVGLFVSLAFIRFSAPDLALTQLSVEVVTIVLLLLALRFLPPSSRREIRFARRVRDVTIALAGGGGISVLSYAVLHRPFDTVSGFFLENSVPGGGGTNVVNVILVDFRAFDTIGEITVLALAALGIQALLEGLRLKSHQAHPSSEADRHPVMLAMLVRPLLPLAIVVSLYILLRGHNLPGGGFIAGLVTAVALILQYIASGIDFARSRLPIDPIRLLAVGLLVATGTGLASVFLGSPFLTSTHGHVNVWPIGDVELATAMVLDAGIYLVVVASTLLVLTELGSLSRREILD